MCDEAFVGGLLVGLVLAIFVVAGIGTIYDLRTMDAMANQLCNVNGLKLDYYEASWENDEVFSEVVCKNTTKRRVMDDLVFVIGE